MGLLAGQKIREGDFIGWIMMWAGSSAPTGFLLCDGSAISRSTYSVLFGIIGTAFGAGDGSTTFNLPDLRGRIPMGVGQNSWTTPFTSGDVDVSGNTIAVASNRALYSGTKIRFTTTGTLPTGLSAGVDYYVIRISATSIKVASSRQNAIGGGGKGSTGTITPIDITGAGSGSSLITVQDLSAATLAERGGEETHPLGIEELPSHVHQRSTSDFNGPTGSSENSDNPDYSGDTAATGNNVPHNNLPPFVGINFIIKAQQTN